MLSLSHFLHCVNGAVAQLGERLNGIQEVRGSIPLGSMTPDRAPVAQLDRASDFGSEGREFESLRAHAGSVGYQSGQMEQTVNLPAYAYVGSNPTPTTEGAIGERLPTPPPTPGRTRRRAVSSVG